MLNVQRRNSSHKSTNYCALFSQSLKAYLAKAVGQHGNFARNMENEVLWEMPGQRTKLSEKI